MSTKDELRNLANDCTGLFSTFVPKQILREAADELDTKQSRIDRLEAELKRASEALRDAAEEVEGWGSYADEHFQKKWDLPACVANINKAADAIDAAMEAK